MATFKMANKISLILMSEEGPTLSAQKSPVQPTMRRLLSWLPFSITTYASSVVKRWKTGDILLNQSSSPIPNKYFYPLPFLRVKRGTMELSPTILICWFSNHWADSLQIKFIGTILACRYTTSCSFVSQALGTLFTGQGTLQWSACFWMSW